MTLKTLNHSKWGYVDNVEKIYLKLTISNLFKINCFKYKIMFIARLVMHYSVK